MLGPRQDTQGAVFYEFSIEGHVPSDHMLRSVDRFVDLSGIRQHLAPFYSKTGRPSVDPELMIRMLLIGYIMGIRSERRLCEEVHLSLAYRWFRRLDLTRPVPDHSTFSKNRHGRLRDSDLLRHLFETGVARCISEGLASGQRLAADASLVQADANRQNSTPQADWNPTRIDPDDAPRAVREYLSTLDDAAFCAASPLEPTFTSYSDPADFAYSTNDLIDTDNGVILDVEATRSIRQAEDGSVQTMIDRVSDTFGIKPERLIADTAYGTFERADFTYDPDMDVYTCPSGKALKQIHRAFTKLREKKPDEDGMLRYRASKADCDGCALKSQCCPKEPSRKVTRSISEPSRDVARAIASTAQYAISCKLRKKVEILFAHLKRIRGLHRLRLRGPYGAQDEFHRTATAQNLRKLAKLLPRPPIPRPA